MFDFSRQISEKFRFFSGNFVKKSIFPGKYPKNFDFFRQFKKSFHFPGKNGPFTATSGQIILFLLKNHHFRTYFLYMIRYCISMRTRRSGWSSSDRFVILVFNAFIISTILYNLRTPCKKGDAQPRPEIGHCVDLLKVWGESVWELFSTILRPVCARTRAQLRGNIAHHSLFIWNYSWTVDNMGDISKEMGERILQDIKIMETRYQGRLDVSPMADYCCMMNRDWLSEEEEHTRKSKNTRFCP